MTNIASTAEIMNKASPTLQRRIKVSAASGKKSQPDGLGFHKQADVRVRKCDSTEGNGLRCGVTHLCSSAHSRPFLLELLEPVQRRPDLAFRQRTRSFPGVQPHLQPLRGRDCHWNAQVSQQRPQVCCGRGCFEGAQTSRLLVC